MALVALITGASTGFGRLTAERLAREGVSVFATMRDTTTRNAAAARELGSLPGVGVLDLDVTSEGSVAAAVSAAGHVDVLVNNAGFGQAGLTECYTVEQWQALFDVNVFGAVRVTRAVLPSMRTAKRGLIVNLTSMAGRVPLPYLGVYCSSKWALEGYSEALRLELAPCGIDCVVVEPGKFRTAIFDKPYPPADQDRAAGYARPDLPQRFMWNFVQTMDAEAQDPAEVADAIAALVAMPAGQRPFRTTVGADAHWLNEYNAAADQVRAAVAQGFGIPETLSLGENAPKSA